MCCTHLGLAHDVAHEVARGGLRHHEVLRPPGEILQVEGEAVHLCQGVQVDPIEPEEVITGELPQRGHCL